MPTYSLAEARESLDDLVARAERGETVTLSRDGRVVAEVRHVPPPRPAPPPMTESDLGWLRQRRVTPLTPDFDSVALIRRMRDED